MKTTLSFITGIALIVTLSLTACSESGKQKATETTTTGQTTEQTTDPTTEQATGQSVRNIPGIPSSVSQSGVTVESTPATFSTVPETIKLIITNNTDSGIEYGQYYTVEQQQGENWVQLPFAPEFGFLDILLVQPEKSTRDFTINLNEIQSDFKSRNYRVRKSIGVAKKNIDFAVGFRIE